MPAARATAHARSLPFPRGTPILHNPSCLFHGTAAELFIAAAGITPGFLRSAMLYICVPAYNEAPTIGLLLWRIRRVFEEFSREYEVLVLDDGSTDATEETLAPYTEVMPLTVERGERRRGYGAALDSLARMVVRRTRYPRRDAMVILQGDFTDPPEALPELVKRFEGGADLVIAEQGGSSRTAPRGVRRLRRIAPWVLKPFVRVPGITDPFGSLKLMRISLVRDLLREVGDRPLVQWNGWAANVELSMKATRAARRVETVTVDARYDLRPRESRVSAFSGALDLYRFGLAARSRRTESVST
jgi:glycosyltransferase involved in cell wall biosynthesis